MKHYQSTVLVNTKESDITALIETTEISPQRAKTGGWFPTDHARARTPEAQAEAFEFYVERSAPYFQAVVDRGGRPWHDGDLEKRRGLFMQRYTRPAPPKGLHPIKSLADLQGGWR